MSHLDEFKVRRVRQLSCGSSVLLLLLSNLAFFGQAVRGQSIAGESAVAPARQTITFSPGEVYLASSRVYVYVDKTGLGHEHGVTGRLRSGTIRLGADRDAGQLVFDMASFRADSEVARRFVGLEGSTSESTRQKVNANMLGVDVLDVQHYPTASFAIESAHPLTTKSKRGLPQYRLDGRLTLHGNTQPVRITADVEQKNGWLHLRGAFALLQSHFGMTPFSKAFGAIGVADALKIWGDIWIAGPQGVTVAAAATRSPSRK